MAGVRKLRESNGRPRGALTAFNAKCQPITGGILCHAGVPNFLGNLELLYEQADPSQRQWQVFKRSKWIVAASRPFLYDPEST